MPIELLQVGPATKLKQNVVYSLPVTLCLVTTSAGCETSLDGTNWTSFTSGTMSGAVFIRSAGVDTIVTCK